MITTWLSNELLLEMVNRLPQEGEVKLHENQLLYLDIDDRFITELCPLIQYENVELPDYFSISMGAHISIIYPNEKKNPIFYQGQRVSFTVKDFLKVETIRGIYFVLTVHAPDLMKIREKNHLGEKLDLNGLMVDMHITIGKIPLEETRIIF